jgi:hypothetical protein
LSASSNARPERKGQFVSSALEATEEEEEEEEEDEEEPTDTE